METRAQPLHHCHAQRLFSLQHFADAARSSQDRDHVCTGKSVLIHQVADHIGRARRPTRPFAFLIGCDQARLRLEPSNVGRLVGLPEPIDKRASSASLSIKIRIASITPFPHLFCHTHCASRRIELPGRLPFWRIGITPSQLRSASPQAAPEESSARAPAPSTAVRKWRCARHWGRCPG
jgi:hypothetical protein